MVSLQAIRTMKDLNIIIVIILFTGCLSENSNNSSAPYASQKELTEPVAFAPDRITTTNGICFSKDGGTLYTSGQIDRKFNNERNYAGIFESHYENGQWTDPQKIKLTPDIDAYHPVLSSDNKMLFFNSRSHPDSGNNAIAHNIWVMHRNEEGWSRPTMVQGINSLAYDSYPSIARNNNLYFNSDREGGKGGMDFYVSHFVDGHYQEPANLENLNSSDVENDLVVDPDERFIIFNRYINATKELDLFISFRKNNKWTIPRKLDNINAPDTWELTPSLSPGGKYFFYELKNNIMQIDLAHLIHPDELEGIGKRVRDIN
ncbi:hypothetical protein QQ008_11350 [Fulvivirgaceae bacterium BMA10]|uniref:Uncharacterized protein n=1 Tax=Splendidivirga corallicola TaxID=3051826 RepID=A0ABT8KMK9_9BACT|nr:hypothetical protein [Fulvivirgaceae bacterium BMA10]